MPRRHDRARVTRAVKKKSGVQFRSGSEQTGWVMLDDERVLQVTVPKGRGDLPPGTENAIRNDLKLSREEFGLLVGCEMTGTEYARLLRDKRTLGLI